MVKLVRLERPSGPKKYTAVFDDGKRVSFGAKGYSDYTKHHDTERKSRYLQRHRSRERWSDLRSPGALSRYLLWNKKSLRASLADYRKRLSKRR